jgi:hypothetical protein
MTGRISAVGFASGDRFVVGDWARSPIGPFADVMWARPDGQRVLLADAERSARFITAVYRFDAVEVAEVTALLDGRRYRVRVTGDGLEPGLDLSLDLDLGRAVRLPVRPPGFVRRVEGPIARSLVDVRTWGISPSGVHEWYRATEFRRVVGATGRLEGRDLGAWGPPRPACGFGFSDAPRIASSVGVRPVLWDPTQKLDGVVADLYP